MLVYLNKKLLELGIKEQLRTNILNDTVVKELSKNKNIFMEGQEDKNEYILLKGVLHRYTISQKGDMITTGFYTGKKIITPHYLRTNNSINMYSLQTLTEALIAEIPVAAFEKLKENNVAFTSYCEKNMQAELSNIYLFESICRGYNAKERLLFLRKHYPNLENLVPHNTIASFLGITHVSFSRIRHKLAST